MTDGEKMIWASAFAAAIGHGSSDRVAVKLATRAVQCFRGIGTEQLADDEREQVEAVRGGPRSGNIYDALQRQVEQAHALAGEAFTARDKLQLEVERIGRVKAAAPETLHLALREADGELERLRKVLADVRDDLEEHAPLSALARLAEVLE